MVVTMAGPVDCTQPDGRKWAMAGILNRMDYAKWHSYQFTIVPEGHVLACKRGSSPPATPAGVNLVMPFS